MSTTAPAPYKRHALGLPAGSVRATHLLIVVALFCAILLIPARRTLPIPPFLVYLLFLMLGHYFAHRSAAGADERPPLHLPRGSIRFLVLVALVGTIGWCLYSDPDKLQEQFNESLKALQQQPTMPLWVLGGFVVGVVVGTLLGAERPVALQDMQAWLSILSAVGLSVAVILHLIVIPSLEENVPFETFEAILAGVVAFYYGERS